MGFRRWGARPNGPTGAPPRPNPAPSPAPEVVSSPRVGERDERPLQEGVRPALRVIRPRAHRGGAAPEPRARLARRASKWVPRAAMRRPAWSEPLPYRALQEDRRA